MPFMVVYQTSDGTSCHEQTDAIDEAALLVERLRNKDGIEDDIRIYRMEEISFAFRPYYKVELGMPERQAPTTPPAEVVGIAADEVVTDTTATAAHPSVADRPSPSAATDPDGDNGRRGLFGR